MQKKYTYLLLFFVLLSIQGRAQDMAYSGDPDASYFRARDLAFAGNRDEARDTLRAILTTYPDYNDVRGLLASTHSWDGDFDEARRHFNTITSSDRQNKEAWIAAIKNEIYAQDYYIALGLANKALQYLDDDVDIADLRTKALESMGVAKEQKITVIPPDTPKDTLEKSNLNNSIRIANAFEIFDVVYDPMVYSSIDYRRETNAGPIISRINYGNRFEIQGLQYEADFYPKFSKMFYGYLNYGFSNSPIYPDHKVGAELYSNLPKAMEASLGIRFLDFNSTKAMIYTASYGLYRGNYYFSVRPYVTPGPKNNLSFSGQILARKYLKDGENFFGIRGGMGFTPELRQLRDGDELLAETVLFIESQQLILEYQFTGKNNPNSYLTTLGVNRQELVFDSGTFFWAISAGLTYQVKF